jgi:hypothetical protein
MQLGSSDTISSTAGINKPERYMADARCAMNLRGTFLVCVCMCVCVCVCTVQSPDVGIVIV